MTDDSKPAGVPSSAVVTESLKNLGRVISEEARKDGGYIPPLLAAFTARAIVLHEQADTGGAGGARFNLEAGLTPEEEKELIEMVLERCTRKDDPVFETMRMQVTFESFYATELHRLRQEQTKRETDNKEQLDKIVAVGTNLQSNAQVASLYRSIFKLMLANSTVEEDKRDRNVEREIAAALESVFPQAGLNAFNMMTAAEKRAQVKDLVNIVLGIRLFNLEIKKGGAGLSDVPTIVSREVDSLYEMLEMESTDLGDLCYTYSDIINLEFEKPGTISASLVRLQDELTNRRQLILLDHQLQHETLESIDIIKAGKQQLIEELEQLKTLVGLRTSVPKEQVYPKFHVLAGTWKALLREKEKNAMRKRLFDQLMQFKDNFYPSLLDEDIEVVKQTPLNLNTTNLDPDEFVETVVERNRPTQEETEKLAALFNKPVRLVKETTPNFMSLPLEYQGYCPWTVVSRQGLLLPGNPNIGIIRFRGKHYSFSSEKNMRDFCEDPEKFTDGVIKRACKCPDLIHLLCLQPYIPNSDISDLFSNQDALDTATLGASSKVDSSAQTPAQYINTDAPDPNYEWNEWAMRRKALQMADLCNRKTHSTQTDLSHFRRENETQTTLPTPAKDGSMPGVGTQTGIDKGTNVERTTRYFSGLRGKPDTEARTVNFTIPEHVVNGSNLPLNQPDPREMVGLDV